MPEPHEEEFNWDDYYGDTRTLSLDARGAWMDCLFHMRKSPIKGRITLDLAGFATMFGAERRKTQRVLEQISAHKVGELKIEDNGNITLTCRRIFRAHQDENASEANKIRQKNWRDRQRQTPDRNGEITEKRNANVTEGKNASYVLVEEEKSKNKNDLGASRIPDPFPLTDEMIEWTQKHTPGLDALTAHENFIEYWTNNTTAKAYKVNWRLTWEKGMKLALKWQRGQLNERQGEHLPDINEIEQRRKANMKLKPVPKSA